MNFHDGYVNGLPKALTKEEEERNLKLYIFEKDEKAREMLINHNLRLVCHVVNSNFPCTNIEYEDLVSVGTIGLVKGVDSFHIDKRVKLATYLSICIKNEILMYMRGSAKSKKAIVVSMEDVCISNVQGDKLSFKEIIPDEVCLEDEVVGKMQNKEYMTKINAFLGSVDKEKKLVFEKLWGLNGYEKTRQAEVAHVTGLSQSYVSRINAKIIKDLNKEITR